MHLEEFEEKTKKYFKHFFFVLFCSFILSRHFFFAFLIHFFVVERNKEKIIRIIMTYAYKYIKNEKTI